MLVKGAPDIEDLARDCNNFIANALGLPRSYATIKQNHTAFKRLIFDRS